MLKFEIKYFPLKFYHFHLSLIYRVEDKNSMSITYVENNKSLKNYFVPLFLSSQFFIFLKWVNNYKTLFRLYFNHINLFYYIYKR